MPPLQFHSLNVDGFKQAKQALDSAPSAMIPVIKETAVLGAGVFRVFSGLDAIYNIYTIFSKEGLKGTPTDLAIRAARVVANVGVIALSGIAAAVAFGATVIAAPIVGAVLGGVSIVKNTFDLIAERRKSAKIKAEIKKLDKQLEGKHFQVSQNIELLNELAQRQANIADMKKDFSQTKRQFEKFETSAEPDKVEMINQRKAELEKGISEHIGIVDFINREKTNLSDIKSLNSVIQSLTEKNDPANEAKLKFATELKETKAALLEVQDKLKQIDNKYNSAPLNKLNSTEKEALIQLDKKLLNEQEKNLTSKMKTMLDPSSRQQAIQKSTAELRQYDNPRSPECHQAFQANLSDKLNASRTQIKSEVSELKSRVGYTKLFLGPDYLNDPKKSVESHLNSNFEQTLNRAKLSHDLKQSKIERKKKWKNIGLGLLGLGVAIAACIPPVQVLLGIALIGVGIVSGVNAIYDYKKKKEVSAASDAEVNALEKAHEASKANTLSHTPSNLHQLHSAFEAEGPKADKQEREVHHVEEAAPTFVSRKIRSGAPESNSAKEPAPTADAQSRPRMGSSSSSSQ